MTRGLFSASRAASKAIVNTSAQGAAVREARRGGSAVRRGLVGPWDSIPAGAGDYLDYSGLATPGELKVAPWSFPLGRYVLPKGRKWKPQAEIGVTTATANKHAVVYAPAGSGKTAGVIVPWIWHALYFGYFVVALDLKGNNDLLDQVRHYALSREDMPNVVISSFDYTDPGNSVSWNWIRDLEDDSAIEAAAAVLVGRNDSDHNKEFRLRDVGWLRGVLEFAVATGQPWTAGTLIDLLNDPDKFKRLLRNVGPPRSQGRLRSLIDVDDAGPIDYDNYFRKVQFVLTYMEPLNTDGVDAVTRRAGVRMRDLGTEPGLLVVTAPLADGKLSETVSGLFMTHFVNLQLKRFNQENRPVLIVLDEAARLKERLDLEQLLATTRSANTSVLLAIQDVDQFEERQRNAILSNCATHILLGGAGERTTTYFGSRLGERRATRATMSNTYGREGRNVQTGFDSQSVQVLGRSEMAHPPGDGFCALVHSYDLSQKPILVDLTRADLARE